MSTKKPTLVFEETLNGKETGKILHSELTEFYEYPKRIYTLKKKFIEESYLCYLTIESKVNLRDKIFDRHLKRYSF